MVESGVISDSDATLDTLTLDSKALIWLTKVSRQANDDSINIGQALMASLIGNFSSTLDNVALEGSGADPNSEGVYNYTNVNDVAFGSGSLVAKWSTVGFSRLLEAQKMLHDDNEFGPLSVIMSPRSYRDMEGLVASDYQPLMMPASIAKMPKYITGSGVISDARTVGSETACSTIYMGNFERLWYVSRLEFNLQVLKERYAENWQLGLLFTLMGNFYPTHEKAFARITGVLDESAVST